VDVACHLASYPKAILRLQNEGLLPVDVVHRTSKYRLCCVNLARHRM
jgi:hypothetical protein